MPTAGEVRVQLGDVDLGHRAFLGRHLALVDQPRVQEPDLPADLDPHLEVGERAPHPRDRAERPAVALRPAHERLQLLEEARAACRRSRS